jgi:hypothetical protein
MEELIKTFEDAKDRIPHLVFEIGYTRITGYMIHMWDSTGTGIKAAPKIFTCQDEDFEIVAKEAINSIREYINQ